MRVYFTYTNPSNLSLLLLLLQLHFRLFSAFFLQCVTTEQILILISKHFSTLQVCKEMSGEKCMTPLKAESRKQKRNGVTKRGQKSEKENCLSQMAKPCSQSGCQAFVQPAQQSQEVA